MQSNVHDPAEATSVRHSGARSLKVAEDNLCQQTVGIFVLLEEVVFFKALKLSSQVYVYPNYTRYSYSGPWYRFSS